MFQAKQNTSHDNKHAAGLGGGGLECNPRNCRYIHATCMSVPALPVCKTHNSCQCVNSTQNTQQHQVCPAFIFVLANLPVHCLQLRKRQITAKLADRYTHSSLLQTSLKDHIIQRADYKTDAHPQSILTATPQCDGILAGSAHLSARQLAMLSFTLLNC